MFMFDRRYWKNLSVCRATILIFLVAVTISGVVNLCLLFLHPERAVQLIDYFNLPPLYITNISCVEQCNSYNYDFSVSSQIVCDKELYLLILVLSSPRNIKQRNAVRKTWGTVREVHTRRVQVVFVVGAPMYSGTSVSQVYKSEQNQHGDLLIINLTDSYLNLTNKTVAALQWAENHCPSSAFIMKTDDDSFNVPDHIVHQLEKIDPHSDFLAGECASGIKPFRDPRHKWHVPESSYPGSYFPLYVRGRGYILTSGVVPKLLKAAQFVLPNTMEDVFLTGMCRLKAGIPVTCWSGFAVTQEGLNVDQCEVTRDDLINIHHVTATQMEIYWSWATSPNKSIVNICYKKSFLQKHLDNLYDAFSF